MKRRNLNSRSNFRSRSGIVLLITLVLLVVLATLGYTLSARVADQRHHDQYVIDYANARYGCDSAVKYALATLETINPKLISRPNEPDFSDLFMLSESEYRELLAKRAEQLRRAGQEKGRRISDINDANVAVDVSDINDVNSGMTDSNDSNSPTIRGPYGPSWPFVTKPTELKIGTATVKIEIEDENAKYPIAWMLLDNSDAGREITAGFETFCEWMDVNEAEIESLEQQLDQIAKVKPFKLEFKKITKRKLIRTSVLHSKGMRARIIPRLRKVTISAFQQLVGQATDFSELLHSSLIDTELLARPTIESETRKESALKYMGIWASSKVNVNTAPRQVLEAALTFGGNADRIAQEIIRRRRIKPFKSIADLKSVLLQYSDSISKCENYLTTVSRFFTIRVTAVSGVAKASTVIAVIKEGGRVRKIAIITG